LTGVLCARRSTRTIARRHRVKRINRCNALAAGLAATPALLAFTGAEGDAFLIAAGQFADRAWR
jgi:hypothetical protein